jgi:hypothetical protein
MLDFPSSPADGAVFQPSVEAGWIAKSSRWRKRGWHLVDKAAPVSVAFSQLVVPLPAQYEVFQFNIRNLRPATNQTHITLYFTNDNFSTNMNLHTTLNYANGGAAGGASWTGATSSTFINLFPYGPENAVYMPNDLRMLIFSEVGFGGACLMQSDGYNAPNGGPMMLRSCISDVSGHSNRWNGFQIYLSTNMAGHGGWELLGLAA